MPDAKSFQYKMYIIQPYMYLKLHYAVLEQPTHIFIHIFLHVFILSNHYLRKTMNNKVNQSAYQKHWSYVSLYLFKFFLVQFYFFFYLIILSVSSQISNTKQRKTTVSMPQHCVNKKHRENLSSVFSLVDSVYVSLALLDFHGIRTKEVQEVEPLCPTHGESQPTNSRF